MNDQSESLGVRIVFGILPIMVSLAIAALLVMAVGEDPRLVLEKTWEGAFRDGSSFAQVVNFWIPLVLASIGLTVTFTAGLWNIGVEGQIIMGAVFASVAALGLGESVPAIILIPIEIFLAILGGVLWGLLVGVLKVYLGVHEIFGGVALNFIATILSIYMIAGPLKPPGGGSAHETDTFLPNARLMPISEEFEVSLLALILAFAAIIAVVLALRGTRWGLQLKATGKNARSALLLGVPTNRTALSAFAVCGGLAGIAGAYRVLFVIGNLPQLVSGGIGFLGLLVVLLVSIRALWVPFIAFAFAVILGGSTRLRIALQLDSSLAGVLQGLLVLTVLLFNGVHQRFRSGKSASAAPTETREDTSSVEVVPNE